MRVGIAIAAAGAACLTVPIAQSQPGVARGGKLEAIAETKVLMEGLAATNMRGVANILRDKPADVEAWTFARGQSLLVAETGNLLLLRPPGVGREAWERHAAELRTAATDLARAAGEKDYSRARAGLASVANVCNRCHQAFRVPHRVDPFQGD
jgi:hypothetical protein